MVYKYAGWPSDAASDPDEWVDNRIRPSIFNLHEKKKPQKCKQDGKKNQTLHEKLLCPELLDHRSEYIERNGENDEYDHIQCSEIEGFEGIGGRIQCIFQGGPGGSCRVHEGVGEEGDCEYFPSF